MAVTNKRVAVDLFSWIHEVLGRVKVARRYVIHQNTTVVVDGILAMLRPLCKVASAVTLVCDGDRFPGKAETNAKRTPTDRNELNTRLQELADNSLVGAPYGKEADKICTKLASQIPRDLFDIIWSAIEQFAQEKKSDCDISIRMAPCEADHQIVALDRSNEIDVVVANDADYVIHCCKLVILGLRFKKKGTNLTATGRVYRHKRILDFAAQLDAKSTDAERNGHVAALMLR